MVEVKDPTTGKQLEVIEKKLFKQYKASQVQKNSLIMRV